MIPKSCRLFRQDHAQNQRLESATRSDLNGWRSRARAPADMSGAIDAMLYDKLDFIRDLASSNPAPLIPRPPLHRPPARRPHVLLERRSAEHHDAGLRAGQIAAFERDRTGVGLVRLDRCEPHRGRARNAQNRAILNEHRGSPWSPSPSPPGNRHPNRPGRMYKVAHLVSYPPLITAGCEIGDVVNISQTGKTTLAKRPTRPHVNSITGTLYWPADD
jgi:hypothetical protein